MAKYLPDLASRSVPRYTSYPTAAEFNDGVGPADQAAALAAIAPGAPVSLYVHIPYCREICWYCGCNTGPAGRPERQIRYLAALDREIELVAGRMKGEVVSIHFGGGSPNALAAADFVALVGRLRDRFSVSGALEIAVELDPRGLDAAYAVALARAGVTRVSLGVQTFAEHVQRRIGRVQPLAMIAAAVRDLRRAGLNHISFDLMYGLPGQTRDDLADTIAEALTLEPDRIAMFGYAHIPQMLPRQRAIDDADLPDAAERFAQSEIAHDMLTFAGFQAIGFDHFALPGDPLARAATEGRLRRNFQGFTDEPGEAIIGLGASAISQFPGLLVQNEKHEGRYRMRVTNDSLAGMRGIVRTPEDRMRADAIERLLCDGSVDLAAVAARHGRPPCSLSEVLPTLGDYAARGLVRIDSCRCELTEDGWPYARLIAACFDRFRAAPPANFSRAI
jgi:oxygen-independent coproporphyrinogen-3 oxidase